MVSPLDWAIVETWQKAGIPLDAVLRGIDQAFESYQRSAAARAGRPLKSLAYCVDAVLDAATQQKLIAAAGTKGPGAYKRPAAALASLFRAMSCALSSRAMRNALQRPASAWAQPTRIWRAASNRPARALPKLAPACGLARAGWDLPKTLSAA